MWLHRRAVPGRTDAGRLRIRSAGEAAPGRPCGTREDSMRPCPSLRSMRQNNQPRNWTAKRHRPPLKDDAADLPLGAAFEPSRAVIRSVTPRSCRSRSAWPRRHDRSRSFLAAAGCRCLRCTAVACRHGVCGAWPVLPPCICDRRGVCRRSRRVYVGQRWPPSRQPN